MISFFPSFYISIFLSIFVDRLENAVWEKDKMRWEKLSLIVNKQPLGPSYVSYLLFLLNSLKFKAR